MAAPSPQSSTEPGPGTAAAKTRIIAHSKSTLRSSEGLDFILQDISDSIFCHFLKNIWLQLQDSSFLAFHQGAQKLQQIASKR